MAMNKEALIKAVAEKTGTTQKAARAFVDAFADVLVEAVELHEGVDLTGIFKIEVRPVAAREKRNPQTGEIIRKEAGHKVHVRPMSRLKNAVSVIEA